MSILNKDSIDRFFDYNLHIASRTIYFGPEVDEDSCNYLIKGLHLLQCSNKEEIKILFNTIGGGVYDGLAIYDYIKAMTCHVTIEVIGQCMSMGTIILQAADTRVAYPNSCFMLHNGSDSFEGGDCRNMEAWAEESRRMRKLMYQIYASRTTKNLTAKAWENKLRNRDLIINTKTALEWGLIDEIK